jgi:hypothetical protein
MCRFRIIFRLRGIELKSNCLPSIEAHFVYEAERQSSSESLVNSTGRPNAAGFVALIGTGKEFELIPVALRLCPVSSAIIFIRYQASEMLSFGTF